MTQAVLDSSHVSGFDPQARHSVRSCDVRFARVGGLDLLARIVRPAPAGSGVAPCLIDIHGGAWSRFDRTAGYLHQRALAACGAVVIAIDFRQAPAHRYPAACQDVVAALHYVRAHARALGIDLRRVGLIGSSSGGQIALEVALKADAFTPENTELFDAAGETCTSLEAGTTVPEIAFVLALFPVSDPIARYRYVLERRDDPPIPNAGFHPQGLIAGHRAYFGTERAMEAASIPRIVRSGEAKRLPPVWVAQPELDQNVPASLTDALVETYRAAGGSIERTLFEGEPHGFVHRPGPSSERCIEVMRDFIARRLGSPVSP